MDYIESTTDQYIDTGKVFTGQMGFDMDFIVTEDAVTSNKRMMGVQPSTGQWYGNTFQIWPYDQHGFDVGLPTGNIRDIGSPTYAGQEMHFELRKNYMKANNDYRTYTSSLSWTSGDKTLYLFKCNLYGSPSTENLNTKLRNFTLMDGNNVLLQDLLPVYKFDGSICMYDFIEGNYLTNQGTGYFKGQFTDRGKVYEILPYIQSTGNAYINTGIAVQGDNIITSIDTITQIHQNTAFYGGGNCPDNNHTKGDISLFVGGSQNAVHVVYPYSNTTSTFLNATNTIEVNGTYKSVYNNGNFTIGSHSYALTGYYREFATVNPMYIFACNRGAPYTFGTNKLHYFKLEYNDGGVRQELVPVRSNGVTGMYDTVSKNVLVNANTTGDFVAPNILPNGYTRLDYIQSSGTQYIDTGVLIDSSNENYVRIEVDGNFGTKISGSNKWSIDGTAYTNICRYIGISASDVLAYGNGGSSFDNYTNYTATETDRTGRHLYVVDYLNGKVKRDGVTVASFTTLSSSTSQPAHNIYIFGWRVGREFQENAKKYGFRIYINDNCVFSGIPCKNPSNVVGMYDTISNTFLTTPSGTGTFTPGSPI